MVHRPIDPRITNIGLDANAFDKDGTPRDQLVDRFQALQEAEELIVILPGGVRDETMHPNTPSVIKETMSGQLFNLRPQRNENQNKTRLAVEVIMRGKAEAGKHAADASHLCEAAEMGCTYFITRDRRILDKRGELRKPLDGLWIMDFGEFFVIYDEYVENEKARQKPNP